MLRVVLFTGGRGSGVLSRRLLGHPAVELTLAINGYDDGSSTGEVRRFLGDALGPSDFRKNASRMAEAMGSSSPALTRLLDARLPRDVAPAAAVEALTAIVSGCRPALLAEELDAVPPAEARPVRDRLEAFLSEYRATGRSFRFADCALGNLVFAGSYLRCGRAFNPAVDDYAALVGLPPGLIEDVTDGTNAHLVAIESNGRVLGTEEDVVNAARPTRVDDIFLIDRPLNREECEAIAAGGREAAAAQLDRRSVRLALNPRLGAKIDAADLIIYAPGTQHSSLYPSYLTPGLSDHIAGNLRATKLLITNLESDAEIAGSSAVALVERALHYLTDKGRRPRPAPCLITHYILNDPHSAAADRPYVPLGQLDTLEDPRLVRIGYFEDGIAGRHNGAKVLEPFVEARLAAPARPRVGVFLYDATSANKLTQTLLEITRAMKDGEADVTVYAPAPGGLPAEFLQRLPFAVKPGADDSDAERLLREDIRAGRLDYVGLCESSGMYRGEDLVALFPYLAGGRLDAVWGSRRLSMRDVEHSYRVMYRANPPLRAISKVGSHLLSLAYLVLYGRYVADTLSGVRIVRAGDAENLPIPFTDTRANQYLLSAVLRRRADLLEVPVQFIPLSPARARRVTIRDGLGSLAVAVRARVAPARNGPGDRA